MYVLFLNVLYIFFHLKYGSETPPGTPQRARAAAHQNERDNHNLDSPEHHRIPHHANPPLLIPLLILPIPQHLPLPENMAILDDPFGPPPPPAQQYQHLPQHLAEQLQNLPALAPAPGRGRGAGRGRGRGRGRGHGEDNGNNGNNNLLPANPVSVQLMHIFFFLLMNFKPLYNNLPAHLAQQRAALPALPARGRGRGRGRANPPPPMPVSGIY